MKPTTPKTPLTLGQWIGLYVIIPVSIVLLIWGFAVGERAYIFLGTILLINGFVFRAMGMRLIGRQVPIGQYKETPIGRIGHTLFIAEVFAIFALFMWALFSGIL